MVSEIDFGKTAGDYAKHRAGFPVEPLATEHRVWCVVARASHG